MTLREKVIGLPGLFDRPIVARRYFPRLCAGMHDKPAVDELVLCIMDDILIYHDGSVQAELIFPRPTAKNSTCWGPSRSGAAFDSPFPFQSPTTKYWRIWLLAPSPE